MLKPAMALLIGLGFGLQVQAQELVNWKGTIKSTENQQIPNATLTFKSSRKNIQTDDHGNFQTENIPLGSHAIRISAMGYVSIDTLLSFGINSSPTHIQMRQDQKMLQGVEVSGKSETKKLIESGFSVNAIDVRKFANTNTDLAQVLNRSTGVKVREKGGVGGEFDFSVNGLSGKQIRFFIDGVPLEVLGSAMNFNTIPVNLAERVEVYKGVVPIELGADALGGAVNIITNRIPYNYIDASVSYGAFNTNKNALIGQWVQPKSGFTVKLNATSNYSDNNYTMRNVEGIRADHMVGNYIPDLNDAEFFTLDSKRFHNRYRSVFGKAEVGVSNKSYADDLYAFVAYSGFNQQLQTGAEQNAVYGQATKNGNAHSLGIRYSKKDLFVNGLQGDTYWSYSIDKVVVTDTSHRKYYWNNVYTDRNAPEIGSEFTINHIVRPQWTGRTTFKYELNKQHQFALNHIFSSVENQSWNALHSDADDNPGQVTKNIIGLSYTQDLLDKRWNNVFFAKYYGLGLKLQKYSSATAVFEDIAIKKQNVGFGISSRYYVRKDLGIKVSAEKAYRLQEVSELFGDGVNTIANPNLKPEHSYNFNAGAFFSKQQGPHHYFVEGSGFVRLASDFIYAKFYQSNTPRVMYDNLEKLTINGLEGEFRYNYAQLLSFSVNASYQQSLSYSNANATGTENTYKKKLPNQPWLFGNTELGLGKDHIMGAGSRLQVNWGLHYIHWYYKTWEGLGATIDEIPNQFIQSASVTASFKEGRYNFSVECNNLSNALAYDNFRLQKEGRAFYCKFRYYIH